MSKKHTEMGMSRREALCWIGEAAVAIAGAYYGFGGCEQRRSLHERLGQYAHLQLSYVSPSSEKTLIFLATDHLNVTTSMEVLASPRYSDTLKKQLSNAKNYMDFVIEAGKAGVVLINQEGIPQGIASNDTHEMNMTSFAEFDGLGYSDAVRREHINMEETILSFPDFQKLVSLRGVDERYNLVTSNFPLYYSLCGGSDSILARLILMPSREILVVGNEDADKYQDELDLDFRLGIEDIGHNSLLYKIMELERKVSDEGVITTDELRYAKGLCDEYLKGMEEYMKIHDSRGHFFVENALKNMEQCGQNTSISRVGGNHYYEILDGLKKYDDVSYYVYVPKDSTEEFMNSLGKRQHKLRDYVFEFRGLLTDLESSLKDSKK